jgi:D-glycero-alpha-D-manno-heptose-7-phosphate kinase
MKSKLNKILESKYVEASAPCRIDLGGTLDIKTFFLPLRHLEPCTFNIALRLPTRVRLLPFEESMVRISSRGFQGAQFSVDEVPFDHPMGLMFAIAAYFRAGGVHIQIDSSSPPRSALGGSSAAGVALVAALSEAFVESEKSPWSRSDIAMLAHAIEESVAGVPCGFQDQLAAVFGGVNAWHWPVKMNDPPFRKTQVIPEEEYAALEEHIAVAYCGVTHESADINSRWVKQFLSGRFRKEWGEIISCTKKFIDSLVQGNYKDASEFMLRETAIRMEMTPDVLDSLGKKLVDAAVQNHCGARFTGAGGGGCIWAIGDFEDIKRLKGGWREILLEREEAFLLNAAIDSKGLEIVHRK